MRKRAFVLAAILTGTMLAAAGCGSKSEGEYAGQTLHIYNWGEYVGENTLSDFEKRTGAHILMDEFESNEQMYIKIANGDSYDILVPSDYMIERLLLEDRLQKLDKSKLHCMDAMTPGVVCLPYDPENDYCVPYFWGTVGIVYDKTKVEDRKSTRLNSSH